MGTIKTSNGTNLFYADWGTGAPVLLVHGWCQNTNGWEYLMHQLTDSGFRCIAYDQRGCGKSDQPWDGYDYATLAADLAEVIDSLGLDDLVLVGHSLGCGVITQYLADYGDSKAKKAVFLGTVTPGMVKSDANPEGIDPAEVEKAVEFIKHDRPAFIYSLADDFFGPVSGRNQLSPYFTNWLVEQTLQASGQAAVECQRIALLSDQREELKAIKLPVLILHGDHDSGPLHLTARPTHELLSNSVLKELEGRHHGMYLTEPEMIAEEIVGFIKQEFFAESQR